MAQSQIIRLPRGTINEVNDPVIGMPATPGGLGVTKFAGQLGKWLDLDDSELIFNSAVGTVYGGRFQYVRLAAAAAVPVVGQILFWDTTVADNLYQVTTSETLSSTTAGVMRAGVCLSASLTPGNYTVIQIMGPTNIMMRAVLTSAGAPGSGIWEAGAGGADLGFGDVLGYGTATTNVNLPRWVGTAIGTPVGGALVAVNQFLGAARL